MRVDYLGKGVACQHCHANFVAQQESRTPSPSESGLALLDRADELLKAVEKARREKERLDGRSALDGSSSNGSSSNGSTRAGSTHGKSAVADASK
ncbi:MAG: hypothetical protein RIC11_03840 [Botrimarina sp.]